MPGIFRSPHQPPGDYRIWVDGSYKEGIIGYGAIIMPGNETVSGGEPGSGPKQAEFTALEKALELVPEDAECIVYSDYKPLIKHLTSGKGPERKGRLTAMYANSSDVHQQEAHRLAEKGREKAAATRLPRR